MNGSRGGSRIEYGLSPRAEKFDTFVESVVERNRPGRVADLGGGANPVLPADVIERMGLDYVVIDASPEELAKSPPGYPGLIADLEAPSLASLGSFDLVVSRWLLEHVRDPWTVHRNIWRMLPDGGWAVHYFPTLYALPFVANRLLPERLSRFVVRSLFPSIREPEGKHAKFPALYRWCRGPTRRQIHRFEALGFAVVLYRGFFGHPYYTNVPLLRSMSGRLASVLARHPIPWLTSYVWVVLSKRPEGVRHHR